MGAPGSLGSSFRQTPVLFHRPNFTASLIIVAKLSAFGL